MGIIAFIILLVMIKHIIRIVLSVLHWIIVSLFTPSRSSRKRTVAARRRSERMKTPEQIELEQIKLERERQRLQYEKERFDIMRENAKHTRWKRLQQYKAQQTGTDRNGQKRQIAEIDLAYYDQSLSDLTVIIDRLRDEYENSVNDKTREKAYKKLSALEARQNTLDKKRQMALNVINGA